MWNLGSRLGTLDLMPREKTAAGVSSTMICLKNEYSEGRKKSWGKGRRFSKHFLVKSFNYSVNERGGERLAGNDIAHLSYFGCEICNKMPGYNLKI